MSNVVSSARSGDQTKGTYNHMKDYVPPPITDRIGSQSRRRRAVLGLYVGYPAFIGAMWLGSIVSHTHNALIAAPFLAVALVAVVAMLWGGYVLLSRTAINLPNLSDRVLDERQRAIRDRAYRISFRIVSAVLLVAGLYMTMSPGFGWPLPRSGEAAQALFWGAFIVTTTLPTAVIAWTEPAPRDETEEGERL